MIHDVGTPTVGSDWHSTADDFSKSGEVGRDPPDLLCTPISDSESRHDFIKDQQGAAGSRAFPKRL